MFLKTTAIRFTFLLMVTSVVGFTAVSFCHREGRQQRILSVQETFPSTRASTRSRLTTSSSLHETSTDEPEKAPKELTPDTVAEMAEVSFLNACLQLAQGYVDVLKLFIVAVKAGYELNMSSGELIERIDKVSPPSAGRELMAEEVKLRNTWIQVIYLVLEDLEHIRKVPGDSQTAVRDTALQETFSEDFFADMRTQHDKGGSFHLEDWLNKHPFPDMDDPTERAIIRQTLRVIWFTFTVLKEEQVCLEEKSGLKAQPPIPGAFADD